MGWCQNVCHGMVSEWLLWDGVRMVFTWDGVRMVATWVGVRMVVTWVGVRMVVAWGIHEASFSDHWHLLLILAEVAKYRTPGHAEEITLKMGSCGVMWVVKFNQKQSLIVSPFVPKPSTSADSHVAPGENCLQLPTV
ncbi:hypothetical protein Btru_051849 [Bulinus truncatus]|nr:hypothetical protein Btru_051849 [Bulinus truncatus]